MSPVLTNNSFQDGNGEDIGNQKLSVDLLGEEDIKAWKDPSFQKALRERLSDEQSITATNSAKTVYEILDRDNRKRGPKAATDLKELQRREMEEEEHKKEHLPELTEIDERYGMTSDGSWEATKSYLKRSSVGCSVCFRMFEEMVKEEEKVDRIGEQKEQQQEEARKEEKKDSKV